MSGWAFLFADLLNSVSPARSFTGFLGFVNTTRQRWLTIVRYRYQVTIIKKKATAYQVPIPIFKYFLFSPIEFLS